MRGLKLIHVSKRGPASKYRFRKSLFYRGFWVTHNVLSVGIPIVFPDSSLAQSHQQAVQGDSWNSLFREHRDALVGGVYRNYSDNFNINKLVITIIHYIKCITEKSRGYAVLCFVLIGISFLLVGRCEYLSISNPIYDPPVPVKQPWRIWVKQTST